MEHRQRRPTARIGSLVAAKALAFSRDGTRLATAGADNRAYIWNVAEANGKPLRHFAHEGAVTAVSFNDDGTRLATGSTDRTVRIWDAGRRQPVGAAAP